MQNIQLGLKKTEDGVQAVITQLSPPMKTKANILSDVYRMLVAEGAVNYEDFANFRAEVEATDLDSEGLKATLEVCVCGHHISVVTYAGKSEKDASFEGLKATLVDLTKCSLITADEATVLETQAREQVPNMPENEAVAPNIGNLLGMWVLEMVRDGRRDHGKQDTAPQG